MLRAPSTLKFTHSNNNGSRVQIVQPLPTHFSYTLVTLSLLGPNIVNSLFSKAQNRREILGCHSCDQEDSVFSGVTLCWLGKWLPTFRRKVLPALLGCTWTSYTASTSETTEPPDRYQRLETQTTVFFSNAKVRVPNLAEFFISPFIVPPVLLQTISTLMSLLMACTKCIQWFFSY